MEVEEVEVEEEEEESHDGCEDQPAEGVCLGPPLGAKPELRR